MIRKIAMSLVVVATFGCEKDTSESAPDSPADGGEPSIEYRVEEEAPTAPLQPIVSRSQLVERDGLVYIQEYGKLFSGSTVIYSGAGEFSIQEYVAGKETWSGYSDEPQELPEELFPADPLYLAAVRTFVARHGPGHNEYFFYSKYGREADLPMLLCSLKSFGESKGPLICTQAHCVDALQSITGATPGHNYSDWVKWWKAKYKRDPPHWEPEKH